jgi:L-lysine 2,3-aminomutase|tara:strand:+ start:30 stop:263 length:234 start_codon:yes stop_codon:yes gene_type:complete
LEIAREYKPGEVIMKDVVKLYSIKDFYDKFPVKNYRAFKYQLKKLQEQNPKDPLLKQVFFNESDVNKLFDKFRTLKS